MPRPPRYVTPGIVGRATALLLCLFWATGARAEPGAPGSPLAVPPDLPPRAGHYVASPEGPRDGGDFGPHTPGTRTSGLQEAFDACRRDRRDLYIVGGAVPAPFENPGGVVSL